MYCPKNSNSFLLLVDGHFPQKLTEKPVTIEGNPVIGLKKSNQTLIRLSNYIKKYERFSRYRIKSMKGGFHLHFLVFPFAYHFYTRVITRVESTFWNLDALLIFITQRVPALRGFWDFKKKLLYAKFVLVGL